MPVQNGKSTDEIKLLLLDYQGVIVPEGESPEDFPRKALNDLLQTCSSFGIILGVVTAFEEIPEDFPEEIQFCCSSLDKVGATNKLLSKFNLDFHQTAFVADGILDLPLLGKVGFSACPCNAPREVRRAVDYIFSSAAGEELLEEISDFFSYKLEKEFE